MKILFIILPLLLIAVFGFLTFLSFKENDEGKRNIVSGIIFSILAVISLGVLIIVPGSIHQIDAGQVAVVKVWGDAKEVKSAGIHYDFWISTKYELYDAKVQQINTITSAYSSDAQPMTLELVVQYQIQTDKVIAISKNYGDLKMLENRIETVSMNATKSVLAQKQAMNIIETRQTISSAVEDAIKTAINDDYYVNIITAVLTDIDFSDAFEKAVEDKMIAEQEKLKAQYENEKAIAKAEADLAIAKKEAEAILERAKQEAMAKEELAKAEANALKEIQTVWDTMDAETKEAMIKKLAIEKWDGKLPETMVGDSFLKWLMESISTGA